MKVLLLTSSDHHNHRSLNAHLLTGLRQRVGTCESFMLTSDQKDNIEHFFKNFVRLAQFDRIVITFSQKEIHRHSLFFRQLPHLCVLNIGERYTPKEMRLLWRNLHVMPWLRVISDDYHLVQSLVSKGFDAYWISPIYDPEFYQPKRTLELPYRTYIYDLSNKIKKSINNYKLPPEKTEFLDVDIKLSEKILPKDILLYWVEDIHSHVLPVIQAMAMGAVVLMQDPGINNSIRYHWKDGYNCLFAENIDSALKSLEMLYLNLDILSRISQHAIQNVNFFSPQSVGDMLGSLLEPDIRQSIDYPKKIRLFGFEL